jgi:hypothetical protein
MNINVSQGGEPRGAVFVDPAGNSAGGGARTRALMRAPDGPAGGWVGAPHLAHPPRKFSGWYPHTINE